jgi:hypothetical protein
MPIIEEVIATLHGTTFFTSLDCRSGFWQVPLAESSKDITTFTTHIGKFKFEVTPFGLKNSPSFFMSFMDQVLEGMNKYALAYMDDILIHTKKDEKDHLDVNKVFDRIRQHKIKLKLNKCEFLKTETKYLGYIIGTEGIKPDPEKVSAITNLPRPVNVREVRAFIGAVGFNRSFFAKYSDLCCPLVNLTKKKAKFIWTDECQAAFDALKNGLSRVPKLSYPDLNKPFILYTDASAFAIGALLTQQVDDSNLSDTLINTKKSKEVPIHFISHKFSQDQQKWSATQREAFAIYFSIKKLRFYLHNSEFVIKTDHRPLVGFLEKSKESSNTKIQSWMLELQQ